jgi:hypothetical protein
VSFPPDLLDELARVFARVALERLFRESAAREPRRETSGNSMETPPSKELRIDEEKKHG